MKAVIEINLDNAAFAETPDLALGNVLLKLAKEVAYEDMETFFPHPIRDVNGNTVGTIEIVEEEE